MLLGVLIAIVGEIVSFYTEYVLLIKPCFSCYVLRYSYLSLIGLQLISIKVKKITAMPLLLTVLIIIISFYGVMGYMNYVPNPCIEACPYGEDIEVSFGLFSLSLAGGIVEFLLMLQASRLIYKRSRIR
ncbi:MAG: disulfide bond formation protein B [Candidatus Korarchaeum sp.]|nr:disulfide bond formation protein B [Candidatus Korarchaeum sp.]